MSDSQGSGNKKGIMTVIWIIGMIAAGLLLAALIIVGGDIMIRRSVHLDAKQQAAVTTEETVSTQAATTEESKPKKKRKDLPLLVNKKHAVPEGYTPVLHRLPNGIEVAEEIYEALTAMWQDCEAANVGHKLAVVSGYRNEEKQQWLLDEEIKKNRRAGMNEVEAEEDALRSVSPSGYSEHETGLCVDILAADYQYMDEKQEDCPVNEWLQAHCTEYGFVVRYPQNKEDVTGFMYESWHFRYVGREIAEQMSEEGLTLEEYIEEYAAD